MRRFPRRLTLILAVAPVVILIWAFFAPVLPSWLRLPWLGQREGVAWFAPFLWLAVVGLLSLIRRDGAKRR